MKNKQLLVLVVVLALVVSTSVAYAATYTIKGSGYIPSVNGVSGDKAKFEINLKSVDTNESPMLTSIDAKGTIKWFDHGTGFKVNAKITSFHIWKIRAYYCFDAVYDPDKKVIGDEKNIFGRVVKRSGEDFIMIDVFDSNGEVYYNYGILGGGDLKWGSK